MPILFAVVARQTNILAKFASCVGNFQEVIDQILPKDFERSRAFLFLNEIKRRFQGSYGSRAHTALPFAMNSEFSRVLANEMKHFSEAKDVDSIAKVQGELDELKHIMVQNIESLTERGEHLDLLVDKAENLNANSVTFRTKSRTLARTLYWKNIKLYVIIGISVLKHFF
ncbi:unnamed protein product [Cyprideis torosa]|uniref:AP-3 complex subunit delta-1 n=1 Tax=Cyprideis torosa TaxID=163714 RepID=A0A7R8W5Q7_9CRUS|nr:unnamed protein product [Cyprideis torosa]CAG0880666.1 unnamed protein product [Cyprideis torosa]